MPFSKTHNFQKLFYGVFVYWRFFGKMFYQLNNWHVVKQRYIPEYKIKLLLNNIPFYFYNMAYFPSETD